MTPSDRRFARLVILPALLIWALLFAWSQAHAQTITGQIIGVERGGMFTLDPGPGQDLIPVHLWGIQSIDRADEGGPEAREWFDERFWRRLVTCEIRGRQGPWAIALCHDCSGWDIAWELIHAGHATALGDYYARRSDPPGGRARLHGSDHADPGG